METTDTLQIKIAKARAELSQDSREAIDAVNWHQIILGMNTKFNSEQIDTLQMETELLLCGLTSTEKFPLELETRMKIPKVEVNALIENLDKLIFKKMQEELEKRIVGEVEKEATTLTSKPLVLDPKFASIPKAVQEAVALSGWKEKLYEIARKHSLTVNKMGALEDITTKTIVGSIKADEFENEIRLKIDLPEDKLKEMISEINTAIFINIKKAMMGDLGIINNEKLIINNGNTGKKIPLPPYKVINNIENKIPVPLPPKLINNEELIIDNKDIEVKKSETAQDTINNIISDKLSKNTSSKTIVKDYSIPKINTKIQTLPTIQGNALSKPHDPYHEEI